MTNAAQQVPERTPLPPPLVYLKRVLNEHYRDHPPRPPARFGRREFGFIFWPNRPGPPPFVRHVAFQRRDDLLATFTRRTPWHAYYSTAFYQSPGERRMQDKGWLGAELIFDLDADHLPHADTMSYQEQLAAVKVQFKRLLDEFVFGDFGFDEKDVHLTFSGGRGYHCHVLADRVMQLDSRARRQIADYVTGKGIEDRELIGTHVRKKGDGGIVRETKHLYVPATTDPGWRGRVGRGAVDILEELVESDWDDAVARLTAFKGIGPVTAEKILGKLRNTRRDASGRNWMDRLASGMGDQGDELRRFLEKEAVRRGVIELEKGETDEPVTADVKRLIRLPGSLHGKTGLAVVDVTPDTLGAFDPLQEAVVLPKDIEDTVVAREPVAVELLGRTWHIPAGQPTALPRAVAFFAVARRLAVPAPA